jgi:hypothetical protein
MSAVLKPPPVPPNWQPKPPPPPRPVVLVRVTDVDVPFWTMVELLIKLMLAAIPAVLLAALILVSCTTFFGLLLGSAFT